jgi:signal transduction histidine kinase
MLAHKQELEDALAELRATGNRPDLAVQIALIEQSAKVYTRTATELAQLRTPSELEHLETAFEMRLQPTRHALDSAVTSLTNMERASARQSSEDAATRLRKVGLLLAGAWGVGLAGTVVLGVIVVRRLEQQYGRVEAAEQAATESAEARKQLLDMVAHDLASPLNAIVLALDIIRTEHVDVPYLPTFVTAAESMERLVNDVLDMSRAERGAIQLDRREVEVLPILDAVRVLYRERAARAGISLRIEAMPLVAFVDRDRIVQVLSNLVGNALRVLKRGGSIVMTATEADGDVRFSVRDDGPGIAAEELGPIFDAYKQGSARGRAGRLGLGLHISKLLVEAHGGRIGVNSSLGMGSEFWFVLPRHETAPPVG